MPISDNIKKLTDLALTDRILTYKERQVIAETALKATTTTSTSTH